MKQVNGMDLTRHTAISVLEDLPQTKNLTGDKWYISEDIVTNVLNDKLGEILDEHAVFASVIELAKELVVLREKTGYCGGGIESLAAAICRTMQEQKDELEEILGEEQPKSEEEM